MKGNLHKKMTFEDKEEKRYIKKQFGSHRYFKTNNRRLYRKKMKEQLRAFMRDHGL